MPITPIHRIQGAGLLSPLAGQAVTTRGVVTGATRRGFFVQDPSGEVDAEASHGIFVFERRRRPPIGSVVEVAGEVVDYVRTENGRPTTQIVEDTTRVLEEQGPSVEPFWLTAERVVVGRAELAALLNRLEGTLVGIPAGSTFVAPSNPFGDYVVAPPGAELARTQHGGVLIDPHEPVRWLPGFRVLNYGDAPVVNVGAELLRPIVGPLNFRVESYQIASEGPVEVRSAAVSAARARLRRTPTSVTVLTLNGFNLDAHREHPDRVNDRDRDVDDDVGDGRFTELAQAIARDAHGPAIVALQEIQDDDGAEITEVVSADRTLARLARAIRAQGGPSYRWADIPPEVGADGGQPGANIRSAFLYDPEQVELIEGSLHRLGTDDPVFEDSRKPLAARFRALGAGPAGGSLEIINVHLASKRHQHGLFAPEQPGFDPRLALRVQQAELIDGYLRELRSHGVDYYVTGDFNDFEFSPTLAALTAEHSTNLVDSVPRELRFDYNHRGISQALMHGVVSNRQLEDGAVEYEILHANALLGAQPGARGDKPSDHAYVLARLELR